MRWHEWDTLTLLLNYKTLRCVSILDYTIANYKSATSMLIPHSPRNLTLPRALLFHPVLQSCHAKASPTTLSQPPQGAPHSPPHPRMGPSPWRLTHRGGAISQGRRMRGERGQVFAHTVPNRDTITSLAQLLRLQYGRCLPLKSKFNLSRKKTPPKSDPGVLFGRAPKVPGNSNLFPPAQSPAGSCCHRARIWQSVLC